MIDARKIVREEAERRKISISKLSLFASVDRGAVHRWLNNPESSIHTDRLNKLMDFCGYHLTKKGK